MIPLEDQEQEMVCRWLDIKKIFYFAVPNGGTRNKLEAIKLKKQGVRAGVSDMVVFVNQKILFIEMKRRDPKLSKTSKEQIDFLDKIKEYTYTDGRVCCGYDEAIAFISEYL